MVHRVLKLLFYFVLLFLSFFPLRAFHSQHQMTSCLFLLWTAKNIVLYLLSFELILIKKTYFASSLILLNWLDL